jgi:tellurite methyltransferase
LFAQYDLLGESAMKRAIVDYGLDADGDWYAVLDCAHNQHVRHRPPFTNRLWVCSEAGRAEKLGERLECVRCDRFEWPDALEMYKRTKIFSQDSVPRGLQCGHRTRVGVWGRIVIEQGALRYHVDEMDGHQQLMPGTAGVIVPQLTHRVEVIGDVHFFVEFHRQ